ncbi:hypothetical protein TNCV_826151 [Trichonephila clavipes]|nr:hypothetical protein TNCV_826151 [Trichonephila clavipes]
MGWTRSWSIRISRLVPRMTQCVGGQCKLNMPRLKHPPVGVVRKTTGTDWATQKGSVGHMSIAGLDPPHDDVPKADKGEKFLWLISKPISFCRRLSFSFEKSAIDPIKVAKESV